MKTIINSNKAKDIKHTKIVKRFTNKKNVDMKHIENILEGDESKNRKYSKEFVNDIRRVAIEHGLNIDYVMNAYKSITDKKNVKYKGSDIVKVLERLEKIHTGEKDAEQDSLKVRTMLQHKTDTEVITTITEMNLKTTDYLKKLADLKNK